MSKLGAMHLTKHTGVVHSGTVIFFHGSGGTGDSMMEWVRLMMLRMPLAFPHLRILYPTAPLQPYTPLQGDLSNVWFDRLDIRPDVPEDNDSLANIEKEVRQLIKQENDLNIPSNRIIIGGFSMGGALALHTAYRWEQNIAGVFAFSSFLNAESGVYKSLSTKKHDQLPKLLQIHGKSDDLVPIEWGLNTFSKLNSLGVEGEFIPQANLGHSLNSRGMKAIYKWIEKTLPEIY